MINEHALAAAAPFITPVAVVDEIVMERNLERMARIAREHQVKLRPHAKTHKSAEVARRQMAHGAVGLTSATMTEAETFAGAGIADLLIGHPPAGEIKLRRLAALAERVAHLAVSLDDIEVARSLPARVDVFWEVDTGQHRIGTLPGSPTVEAVKRLVRVIGEQRFRGLITHAGHSYGTSDQDGRHRTAHEESEGLLSTAEMLRQDGLAVRELSLGSTPTAGLSLRPGITEMRPGTYVYGDANVVTLGAHKLEDCALVVVATVVSTPAPDRAVADAGSKALAADLRVAGLDGYGIVLGHEHLTVARLSEEHAVLMARDKTGLTIGDRLAIIPAHACTTVNLHPAVLLATVAGAARWMPVDARGWQ